MVTSLAGEDLADGYEQFLLTRHSYWWLYCPPEPESAGHVCFRLMVSEEAFPSLWRIHPHARDKLKVLVRRYLKLAKELWGAAYLDEHWVADPETGTRFMHVIPRYGENSAQRSILMTDEERQQVRDRMEEK